MTTLEIERALAGELPDGFVSTLASEDRLRELANQSDDNLSDVVEDYDGNTLTERNIIRAEIQRSITAFQTPDTSEGGTLELPGTALEFSRILNFAAHYKEDNDTPSGTIKTPKRANTDDIVFSFANPEVYEEVSGQSQDHYEITGITGGNTIEVIDTDGLAEAGQSGGTSLSLDQDEMMYFTGDFIDVSGGRAVLTKFQWNDIDGKQYGPVDAVLDSRLSATHIATAQGAWVKSSADLDAKGYLDGKAELIPIAYYMGPGNKAPALV